MPGCQFSDVRDLSLDEVVEPGPRGGDGEDQAVTLLAFHRARLTAGRTGEEKGAPHMRVWLGPGDRQRSDGMRIVTIEPIFDLESGGANQDANEMGLDERAGLCRWGKMPGRRWRLQAIVCFSTGLLGCSL